MQQTAYSQTLTASGGTAPYTFAVTAGALPSGLTLASNGALTGTPTADGAYTFSVTATDALGFTATRAYAVTVAPRPDPTQDAEVRGLLDAQAQATRRFATAQIDNFHARLESLHGRGGSHSTSFSDLHLGDVVDDVVRAGAHPFAIASVDGGDHGYWHRRADGTDAGAMVVDDLVPMLRERGLRTTRLGLYGWSMGGYGALLLTGKHLLRPRAVAVSSPALFASAELTAAGRPAILIPFGAATDDHQTANAREMTKAGGARTIPQGEFTPEALSRQVEAIASDPNALANAAARSLSVGRPHAASDLADLVERVGGGLSVLPVGLEPRAAAAFAANGVPA